MNHDYSIIIANNSLFCTFPNNSVNLSKLLIHFDVVTLSFCRGHRESLIHCLNSHFGYEPKLMHVGNTNNKNDNPTYTKQRKYERNGKLMAEVIYDKNGICPDLIKIHPPHDELFDLIWIFFADKTIQPTVSSVELAFNFFSDNPRPLQYYIESIWWHKHVRGKPFVIDDLRDGKHSAYSTGDNRQEDIKDRKRKHPPSTTGKTYEKDKLGEYEEPEQTFEQDGEEDSVGFESTDTFTRMEFTFRRTSLSRKGINGLNDLHKLWELDLSKVFNFSTINYFDWKENGCLCSSLHKKLTQPYLQRRRRKRTDLERFLQLARRHTESRLTDVAPDPWKFPPERLTLMQQVHALKAFLRPYAYRAGISKIDHTKFLRPTAQDLFRFVVSAYQKEGMKWQA
jgi:uncharacterized protein YkuJ